jgi:RNA polymerase sigma-70 factor (ECF subfamily)
MEKRHFPQFYRKHVQKVYRFLYYRVYSNKELAQDLTQDVFIKALEGFDKYDESVSEFSWIFTIARNHLLNTLARTKPTVELEHIENTDWDMEDWAGREELKYDEKRVLEAILGLSKEDADLVRLKYLEGWSYDEIAEINGKKAGALRIQAHRALKQMRDILKQR